MKYLLAALSGAAVGAGAALLFAPQTGNETRSLIRDKATKYSNDVQDFAKSKSEHLSNKMKGFRHMSEDLMGRGREMMDQGKEAMDMAMSGSSSGMDQGMDSAI